MGVVWAIARLTLFASVRRRTPIALVLLAVVAGPALSMFLEGDLRLEGLLKTVLTWNVGFISAATMLLALFLSTSLLGRDIAEKHIYMSDAKPVHRWQQIVGRWLGIVLLLGWLLVLAWGATFVVVFAFSAVGRSTMAAWGRSIVGWGALALVGAALAWLGVGRLLGQWRRWGWVAAACVVACGLGLARDLAREPVSHDARAADMAAVRDRLLTARRAYRPARPDIEPAVQRRYAQALAATRRQDLTDTEKQKIRDEIVEDLKKNTWRIPWAGSMDATGMDFTVPGLPPSLADRGVSLVLRYTLHLRHPPGESGPGYVIFRFTLRDGSTFPVPRPFKAGAADEIQIPADAVLRNGDVHFQIVNANAPKPTPDGQPGKAALIIVPLDVGLELLAPVGRFDVNLARGFLLLWIRLAMITMVGLAANTFLSGPVAAMAVFTFLVIGLGNAFWIKEMTPDPILVQAGYHETGAAKELGLSVAGAVLSLAPNFNATDPVPDLIVGREIGWFRLAWQAFFDLGLRGGLAALLGIAVFTRREIDKPTSV